jgi:hypothetical protein
VSSSLSSSEQQYEHQLSISRYGVEGGSVTQAWRAVRQQCTIPFHYMARALTDQRHDGWFAHGLYLLCSGRLDDSHAHDRPPWLLLRGH